MPTLPVDDRILDDMVTALQGIDGTGKYHNTMPSSYITRAPTSIPKRFPWIVLAINQDDPAGANQLGVDDAISHGLTVSVFGWIKDENNPDKELSKILSDIRVALEVDWSRSGLATDTAYVRSTRFFNPGGVAVIETQFLVGYQDKRSDPATEV